MAFRRVNVAQVTGLGTEPTRRDPDRPIDLIQRHDRKAIGRQVESLLCYNLARDNDARATNMKTRCEAAVEMERHTNESGGHADIL